MPAWSWPDFKKMLFEFLNKLIYQLAVVYYLNFLILNFLLLVVGLTVRFCRTERIKALHFFAINILAYTLSWDTNTFLKPRLFYYIVEIWYIFLKFQEIISQNRTFDLQHQSIKPFHISKRCSGVRLHNFTLRKHVNVRNCATWI